MSTVFKPAVSIQMTDLVPGGTVEFLLNAHDRWALRLRGDPKPPVGNFPSFISATGFAQEEFSQLTAAEIRARFTS